MADAFHLDKIVIKYLPYKISLHFFIIKKIIIPSPEICWLFLLHGRTRVSLNGLRTKSAVELVLYNLQMNLFE